MLPFSKRLLVTYGHPCDSVFSDFLDPFRREADEIAPEEDASGDSNDRAVS
jgi:hypothetical protein